MEIQTETAKAIIVGDEGQGRSASAYMKLLRPSRDVELEAKDNHSRTLMSFASWIGYEAVVKLLLEKRAKSGFQGQVFDSGAAIMGSRRGKQL